MLFYVLLGLLLVLTGVAGLQFTYLYYLGRFDTERKKHLRHLERRCLDLSERLAKAESRLAQQDELLQSAYPEMFREEEVWADVIDER